MFLSYRLVVALCLLALVFSVPVFAQETEKNLSLNNAKTFADVGAYLQQEGSKHNFAELEPKQRSTVIANLLMPAGDKLLEIAQNPLEKRSAYGMKLAAFQHQIVAGIAGAEQNLEAFLNTLSKEPDAQELVSSFRFAQFCEKAMKAEPSAEQFSAFNTELKTWIEKKIVPLSRLAQVGLQVAERNKVSGNDFIKELTAYIQSPQCAALSAEEKKEAVDSLEALIRLSLGNDPKLYGKTIDDKDFNWQSLRGKYVLIKFTATWCGPCKMEIPGMLEAYKKYHDKGLEIVSVYVFDREEDPVAAIKELVAEEKLPWIILSETLTEKAKQPKQSEFYGVTGVPTMVLTDKEGKIILTEARGTKLQDKLAEIFK